MGISEEDFEEAVDDLAKENFERENPGRDWIIVKAADGVSKRSRNTASPTEREQHLERARKELKEAAKKK